MFRRTFPIFLVLSLLLVSLLISTPISAQTLTSTPTRTPTTFLTVTPTSMPGSDFSGTPLSGAAPLVVQFTHLNGSILSSCSWTFGDGTGQSFAPPQGSTFFVCPSVTHTYTAPGSYSVSLRVTKATNGFTGTTVKPNYILVSGPTFTPVPTNTMLSDLVVTNIGSQGSSPACANSAHVSVTVSNIGQGSAGAFMIALNAQSQSVASLGSGQQVTVSFTRAGDSNTAVVDSTNIVAETNESNNSLTISLSPLPTAVASCTPTSGPSLTPTRTPPTLPAHTYTPVITSTRTPTPTSAPAADFSGTPLSGNAPLMVSFTHNLGSVLPPGTLVTCTWNFGDGQSQQFIDTCFNTNHTYTSLGGYTVSLQYSSAGAGSGTVTKPNYISVLSGPTSTRTRTPTATVMTPDPTPILIEGCSPVTSTITAPFSFDGAGTFCWQSSNLGAYINSWNTSSVMINGINITNLYVPASSYPAKVAGFWYVGYNSTVAWGHFEAK